MEPGTNSAETECLLEIIRKAYEQNQESKEIGITDILKAYDDFIATKNIDSKSELASELYRAIIRASRNKTGDWFQKITNDSMLKQSGEFASLDSSEKDRNFFSFGDPQDSKIANTFNFGRMSLRRPSGNEQRDSITDYLPERDVPSDHGSTGKKQRFSYDDQKSSYPHQEVSTSTPRPLEAIVNEDLSKIYRNRYVADFSTVERYKPKRVTIAEEIEDKAQKSGLLGLSSIIGQYDLSPIREQKQTSERPAKLRDSHSEDYRKDTAKLSSTGYANRYLSQTQSTQLNEFTVTSPQGGNQSSNRKIFSPQDKLDKFRSTSDNFDDQQTKASFHVDSTGKSFEKRKSNSQLLHAYFQALRIHTLRLKRARRTAEDIKQTKDQRIKEHIFYILKNLLTLNTITKNDMIHAYSLYEKNTLAKCFAGMKQLTKAVRSFRSQRYGYESKKTLDATQKAYEAWKNVVAGKKHDEVAVYTARYLREKTLTKKAMKSFIAYILRKKELRILSLQVYQKYKSGLVSKYFEALKMFKVTKDRLENAKIDRIERSIFFARKRGFTQLKKGIQRTLNKTQGKRNAVEFIQLKAKRTFFQRLRE